MIFHNLPVKYVQWQFHRNIILDIYEQPYHSATLRSWLKNILAFRPYYLSVTSPRQHTVRATYTFSTWLSTCALGWNLALWIHSQDKLRKMQRLSHEINTTGSCYLTRKQNKSNLKWLATETHAVWSSCIQQKAPSKNCTKWNMENFCRKSSVSLKCGWALSKGYSWPWHNSRIVCCRGSKGPLELKMLGIMTPGKHIIALRSNFWENSKLKFSVYSFSKC